MVAPQVPITSGPKTIERLEPVFANGRVEWGLHTGEIAGLYLSGLMSFPSFTAPIAFAMLVFCANLIGAKMEMPHC